ncbi:general secretion pathway protein GspK [Xanthobacter sp. AM11]|uniref:general secretion pathway protein GspK n=1 Tax=Xanthobacter sp. AM11 TaxID=3380643 RepID=UPI0039BF8B0E
MTRPAAPSRPVPRPRRARTAEDGFVLVVVLWILAALATFVSIYAVYVSDTASAAAVRTEALAAHGLASAAVELAALRLVATPKEQRPTRGEVRFRMGGANISAAFTDEAARIDINAASRELMAGLFTALGAAPEAASQHAERIAAWRSPQGAPILGEAPTLGDAPAGEGQRPRGGPFVHVEEIWRVAGLPPALVAAALPYLTVYSGRGQVNGKIAEAPVRLALEKATPGAEGGDGEVVASAAGTTTKAGDTARIKVRIAFDGGRRRGAEAVILLRDFGADPYRVLTWREDGDPPPAPARGAGP